MRRASRAIRTAAELPSIYRPDVVYFPDLKISCSCTAQPHELEQHRGARPAYLYRSTKKMNPSPHEPPVTIDGARVLEWAWSGDQPFGEVPGADSPKISGLAIATYDDQAFYRFSCNHAWETQQDGLYDSIDEAKRQLPDQYRQVVAQWIQR